MKNMVWLRAATKDPDFNKWEFLPSGVTVNDSVYLDTDVEQIPVKFGEIIGNFDGRFPELITLKNFPRVVSGEFDISGAPKITSLVGGPDEVHDGFFAHETQIKTLEGGPDLVKTVYHVANTPLESLLGAPNRVNGRFRCTNTKITSLIGGPEWVDHHYLVNQCAELLTLDGISKHAVSFSCEKCPKLRPWEMRHALFSRIVTFKCDYPEINQLFTEFFHKSDAEKQDQMFSIMSDLRRIDNEVWNG